MQAPNPQTPSLLDLCNTSTHTCDKKHKLSCLWLQDHSWRFRSSTPLMAREDSNFYNTGSWDSLRNNTGRIYKRAFLVQNPRYKRGTLFPLWKAFLKTCLGFPLYTKRSRTKTLILNGLELLFGLNSNSADTILDRSSLTFDRSSFAILHSKFLHSARFKL